MHTAHTAAHAAAHGAHGGARGGARDGTRGGGACGGRACGGGDNALEEAKELVSIALAVLLHPVKRTVDVVQLMVTIDARHRTDNIEIAAYGSVVAC
jgi:hypothetical protein